MKKQLHLNNFDYFFWEIEILNNNHLVKLPLGLQNEQHFKRDTLVLSQRWSFHLLLAS